MTPTQFSMAAPRRALAWGLFFFLAGQAALSLALYGFRPELRDPEYGRKLNALRKQTRLSPGRPLVVVLGSSRVAMGLRPAVLDTAESNADSTQPILFNFSLLGAGPVMELMCLQRLLSDGVRPKKILIECWPPFWHQEGAYAEECRLDINRLTWNDIRCLRPYLSRSRNWFTDCLQAQLCPSFAHRFILLSRWAPGWVAWNSRRDDSWRGLDGWGWLARPRDSMTPEEHWRAVEGARAYYEPVCRDFRLSPISDRAVRDLLELCKREQIPAALLILPESEQFQQWYPKPVRAQVEQYFSELHQSYGVPIVDTRTWMAEEDFIDGFHLLPRSATRYTQRFGREILPRLFITSPPESVHAHRSE